MCARVCVCVCVFLSVCLHVCVCMHMHVCVYFPLVQCADFTCDGGRKLQYVPSTNGGRNFREAQQTCQSRGLSLPPQNFHCCMRVFAQHLRLDLDLDSQYAWLGGSTSFSGHAQANNKGYYSTSMKLPATMCISAY